MIYEWITIMIGVLIGYFAHDSYGFWSIFLFTTSLYFAFILIAQILITGRA